MALPDGTRSLDAGNERYIAALEKLLREQASDIRTMKQQIETLTKRKNS